MDHLCAIIFTLIISLGLSMSYEQRQQEDEDYIDNSIDLIPTSISPPEDFILKILNPLRIFNRFDVNNSPILSLPSDIHEAFFGRGKTSDKIGFGDIMNQYPKRIQAIFPGTLWCGVGHVARSSNDIGLFRLTDSCCRIHDSCPEYIDAGRDNRGLKNNGIFARSHCSCDEEFYRCLRKADTLISNKIGTTYFDILQPQCFRFEYPIKRCLRYSSFPAARRCMNYEFDTYSNKTWQWFDSRIFLNPFHI